MRGPQRQRVATLSADIRKFPNLFLRKDVLQTRFSRPSRFVLLAASRTNSSPGEMSDASLFRSLCAPLAVPWLPCWLGEILRRRMTRSAASASSPASLCDGMPITASLTAAVHVGGIQPSFLSRPQKAPPFPEFCASFCTDKRSPSGETPSEGR